MKGSNKVSGLLRLVMAKTPQDLAFLQAAWREHDPGEWSSGPEIYQVFGQRVLQIGEPLLAYDVVSEGLKWFAKDAVLRQLVALALARSGATKSANVILAELYNEGHRDEETLGLLARTHKDLAAAAVDSEQRILQLRNSYRFYTEAYKTTGGYWTGINAATMACLLDQRKQAEELASEVERTCTRLLREHTEKSDDRYWLLSTLGEAALVQQNWDEAEKCYHDAVEAGSGRWGNLQSTRHNARLLLEHLGEDSARFEQLFRFPTVIVFSGHLLDRPDRIVPRFPAKMIEAVKAEIRRRVDKLNGRFGYASAACGADILFHEVMLEVGGEVHVILPFARDLFRQKSVEVVGDGQWVKRFETVIGKAVEVQELSLHDQEDDGPTHEFDNRMLNGLARLRAEQLETKLIPLAVWDGNPGDGPGGTADNVARWRELGWDVEIIEVGYSHAPGKRVKRSRASVTNAPAERKGECPSEFAIEIRALMFADFEGFSRLSDTEVPRFVAHCLGLVGRLAAESPHKPMIKNTWGDGLYMVFANMRDAGGFALELCDAVAQTPWQEKGLPPMRLRIGLHAGPVFRCTDPVTQRCSYIGAHVSRAARIEPVTPPGQVYASQVFAALAADEGVTEFRCDYVGQTSLAKKYGTYPTYVVLRHATVSKDYSASRDTLAKQVAVRLNTGPTGVG